MYSYKSSVKPSTPALQSTKILDQLRERIRYMHYSLSTEQVYVYWVRFFIRWSGNGSAMRHPRDMGAREVEAFLTHLATDRKVSASTHNQALSAILFLYREVLAIELPWLNGINRPAQKRRIPSLLTKDEVAGLFAQMHGEVALNKAVLLASIAKPVSVHTLRHSFATHLLQAGTDIRTVQELLSDSDVSTTMICPHVLKVAAGGTASPLDAMLFGN